MKTLLFIKGLSPVLVILFIVISIASYWFWMKDEYGKPKPTEPGKPLDAYKTAELQSFFWKMRMYWFMEIFVGVMISPVIIYLLFIGPKVSPMVINIVGVIGFTLSINFILWRLRLRRAKYRAYLDSLS